MIVPFACMLIIMSCKLIILVSLAQWIFTKWNAHQIGQYLYKYKKHPLQNQKKDKMLGFAWPLVTKTYAWSTIFGWWKFIIFTTKIFFWKKIQPLSITKIIEKWVLNWFLKIIKCLTMNISNLLILFPIVNNLNVVICMINKDAYVDK
jgi:hypothetical protein